MADQRRWVEINFDRSVAGEVVCARGVYKLERSETAHSRRLDGIGERGELPEDSPGFPNNFKCLLECLSRHMGVLLNPSRLGLGSLMRED